MSYQEELEKLRKEMDVVDMELYTTIFKRSVLVTEIGKLKKQYGVTEMSIERRKEIIDKFSKMAKNDGIHPIIVEGIFTDLIDLSVLEQKLIMYEKEYD